MCGPEAKCGPTHGRTEVLRLDITHMMAACLVNIAMCRSMRGATPGYPCDSYVLTSADPMSTLGVCPEALCRRALEISESVSGWLRLSRLSEVQERYSDALASVERAAALFLVQLHALPAEDWNPFDRALLTDCADSKMDRDYVALLPFVGPGLRVEGDITDSTASKSAAEVRGEIASSLQARWSSLVYMRDSYGDTAVPCERPRSSSDAIEFKR